MTIRRHPTDFLVREIIVDALLSQLEPVWSPKAQHALYELTKQSLTTPAGAGMLAHKLGFRPADVVHAGLKDKHALTTQAVTIRVRTQELGAGLPAQTQERAMSAKLLGWLPRPVVAPDIEANSFAIIVRDLSAQACERMDVRAKLLRDRDALLLPNYFGDQRFAGVRSMATERRFAAQCLLAGDFEGALKLLIATPTRKESGATRTASRLCIQHWGKWSDLLKQLPKSPARNVVDVLALNGSFLKAFEALPYLDQQMCVESFQSHLWNRAAAQMIRDHTTTGWVEPGATSELAFTNAADVPLSLRDVRVPMPSPSLADRMSSGSELPWAGPMKKVLADERIRPSSLRIPGLRRPSFDDFDRPLFVRPRRFTMTQAVPEAKRFMRELRFDLPSGVYATNLLRALGE